MLKKPSDVTVLKELNRPYTTADYPRLATMYPRTPPKPVPTDFEQMINVVKSRHVTKADKLKALNEGLTKIKGDWFAISWSPVGQDQLLFEYHMGTVLHQMKNKLNIAKVVKALTEISSILKRNSSITTHF